MLQAVTVHHLGTYRGAARPITSIHTSLLCCSFGPVTAGSSESPQHLYHDWQRLP